MEFTIKRFESTHIEKYYIVLTLRPEPFGFIDREIMDVLDIPSHIFDSIMQSHNAIKLQYFTGAEGFEFHTKEDAEAVVQEFEPYLIMKELIE